jgi:macrolide transport system ATP-binding/permease protein
LNGSAKSDGGTRDDGKYSLFPTETYQYLRKSAPEFEELAAMQAGGFRDPSCPENGRPEWTRTIDLLRVREAL